MGQRPVPVLSHVASAGAECEQQQLQQVSAVSWTFWATLHCATCQAECWRWRGGGPQQRGHQHLQRQQPVQEHFSAPEVGNFTVTVSRANHPELLVSGSRIRWSSRSPASLMTGSRPARSWRRTARPPPPPGPAPPSRGPRPPGARCSGGCRRGASSRAR